MQVLQAEGTIYMVLEYGDIDLARLLAKHEQAHKEGGGGGEIDENFIRLYWQQMLQVCYHCCGMTPAIEQCCTKQLQAGCTHRERLKS